jgi:hypothetical protein
VGGLPHFFFQGRVKSRPGLVIALARLREQVAEFFFRHWAPRAVRHVPPHLPATIIDVLAARAMVDFAARPSKIQRPFFDELRLRRGILMQASRSYPKYAFRAGSHRQLPF